METVHLLRSPTNAAHLQRSLEQAERGEWLELALIEPGQAGAGSMRGWPGHQPPGMTTSFGRAKSASNCGGSTN